MKDGLVAVLEESRDRGFLGPGPVTGHLTHARAFEELVGPDFTGEGLDLGSGGGVPGLILAARLEASRWVLLDREARRVRFLARAVTELGLGARVRVIQERAEMWGRSPGGREVEDVVVARSFGPPARVAECGGPLLGVGGRLIVSEPPGLAEERWPEAGVARVGLGRCWTGRVAGAAMAVLEKVEACPERFPRRPAAMARDPLF